MNYILAEYIWIDGRKPTQTLRSKTKVLKQGLITLKDLPVWAFDGSSTFQSETRQSDLILKPVYYIPDPIRGEPHILVLCEVFDKDDKPHLSNKRANLRQAAEKYEQEKSLFGIEQEYTLFDEEGGRPYRWPKSGTAFPAPQGHYYCGVGSDEVYGRKLPEEHLKICLKAGLKIEGIHPEVMPAQWEFQIGPLPPLEIADQLWLSRWLLYRLGEEFGISAKLYPKPVAGDWNGTGGHTNFSTENMRSPGGIKFIEEACKKLEKFHKEHIKVYGADNDKRLTGRHETCDINTFRWGVADRGASVRIPLPVYLKSCGYLEDRRPAANFDPYQVCAAILETICGNGFKAV